MPPWSWDRYIHLTPLTTTSTHPVYSSSYSTREPMFRLPKYCSSHRANPTGSTRAEHASWRTLNVANSRPISSRRIEVGTARPRSSATPVSRRRHSRPAQASRRLPPLYAPALGSSTHRTGRSPALTKRSIRSSDYMDSKCPLLDHEDPGPPPPRLTSSYFSGTVIQRGLTVI
jgi:hypothetical protein